MHPQQLSNSQKVSFINVLFVIDNNLKKKNRLTIEKVRCFKQNGKWRREVAGEVLQNYRNFIIKDYRKLASGFSMKNFPILILLLSLVGCTPVDGHP